MSKTKLAIFIFTLAFGVNIAAFVFSKKTFTVEEVKSIWVYELPRTPSPLDAYSAQDLGPAQGVIGTLFAPSFEPQTKNGASLVPLLAEKWQWDGKTKSLTVKLRENLTYADQSPILADHFVQSAQWVKNQMKRLVWTDEWNLWLESSLIAVDANTLIYTFPSLKGEAIPTEMIQTVFSHPFAGVIYPAHLASLEKGEVITRKWISSGPYKVRKWEAKEIVLVSRDDFPVMLPKEFFRTLRYQSSPVKNPSCEFSHAAVGEELPSKEHRVIPVNETLHVYWVCRSWKEKASFCANPANRKALKASLENKGDSTDITALRGQVLRYRIPSGSDSFRAEIINALGQNLKKAGGETQEISFFFKPSTAADLELLFVVSGSNESEQNNENFAQLSSRLGGVSKDDSDLVGEVKRFPIEVLMKNMKGTVFDKVFLQPDLEEKKMLSI